MIGDKRVKAKSRKRKDGRTEKDPNAPKRPANPFFQFCQEQRPLVLDHMITSGQREPSKQDLTKQLAANWNVLSRKDKKVSFFRIFVFINDLSVCLVGTFGFTDIFLFRCIMINI